MKTPVMLQALQDIDVIALDARVANGLAGERARRLLENRQRVAPHAPVQLLIATHDTQEEQIAEQAAQMLGPLATVTIQLQRSRNETVPNALRLHRRCFPPQMTDSDKGNAARLDRILWLSRRGGKSKPHFIDAFTAGADTTCGRWTRVVAYQSARGVVSLAGTRPKAIERQEKKLMGFLRSNLVQGVCPVDCAFCYLRGVPGMAVKQVALNLEDLIPELEQLPPGSVVNHAELGGLVEMDPWFVSPDGQGSLVQRILDLSSERSIVSFFLTKGVYEPYLQVQDRLAVFAISLNAPEISRVFEPGGATAEARLRGLRWAIDEGVMDSTVRFGPIIPVEGYDAYYRTLFEMMRDILGDKLRRMTVDVLRFSEQLPPLLRGIFPEEIVTPLLAEMESEVRSHKFRPSVERQRELYGWVRRLLEEYGMEHVVTTPCKADPTEARGFLNEGLIQAMPCACHIGAREAAAIKEAATRMGRGRTMLPMFSGEERKQ